MSLVGGDPVLPHSSGGGAAASARAGAEVAELEVDNDDRAEMLVVTELMESLRASG